MEDLTFCVCGDSLNKFVGSSLLPQTQSYYKDLMQSYYKVFIVTLLQ